MGKKKETVQGQAQAKAKKRERRVDLEQLRGYIAEKKNAHDIMDTMKIKQIGSLRNAVFMLSQIDERFYTVPGIVDEFRFKPIIRVGKSGIKIPIERIPFAIGSTLNVTVSAEDGVSTITISGPTSIVTTETEQVNFEAEQEA